MVVPDADNKTAVSRVTDIDANGVMINE